MICYLLLQSLNLMNIETSLSIISSRTSRFTSHLIDRIRVQRSYPSQIVRGKLLYLDPDFATLIREVLHLGSQYFDITCKRTQKSLVSHHIQASSRLSYCWRRTLPRKTRLVSTLNTSHQESLKSRLAIGIYSQE